MQKLTKMQLPATSSYPQCVKMLELVFLEKLHAIKFFYTWNSPFFVSKNKNKAEAEP